MEQPVESAPSGFEAFLNAQMAFKTAIKDSLNPHFKSKFADFASIYDAVSEALHTNGLFVMQPTRFTDTGHPIVETIVRYKDGTVIETSQCPVVCKQQNDPQAMGSAITYARRYSLASILCVVTDDDDAEAATAPTRNQGNATATNSSSNNKAVTHSTDDLTDWHTSIDACADAADLNRIKKNIAGAKLLDHNFKAIWSYLVKRAKVLNCTYDTTSKKFS